MPYKTSALHTQRKPINQTSPQAHTHSSRVRSVALHRPDSKGRHDRRSAPLCDRPVSGLLACRMPRFLSKRLLSQASIVKWFCGTQQEQGSHGILTVKAVPVYHTPRCARLSVGINVLVMGESETITPLTYNRMYAPAFSVIEIKYHLFGSGWRLPPLSIGPPLMPNWICPEYSWKCRSPFRQPSAL